MADHGGRIAPDNRGSQAKGVGKNSKRHDLERRTVPFLQDSDLQQGDVQALEQGQRIAPKQTQRPAAPPQTRGQPRKGKSQGQGLSVPDPIEFLGGRSKGLQALPGPITQSEGATAWLPFVRQMVIGPGSSGLMAGAYINQFRQVMAASQATTANTINLEAMDDALEAGLNEGF